MTWKDRKLHSSAVSAICVNFSPVRQVSILGWRTCTLKQKLAEQKIKYKPEKTEFEPRSVRPYRLVPSKRLIARLGLRDFDLPAPMTDIEFSPACDPHFHKTACGCAGSSGRKCRTAGAGRADDRADPGRQSWCSDPYKYQRHGQRSDGRLY